MIKKSSGDPAQLRIHDSEQPLTSILIAVTPVCEPRGDFLGTRKSPFHSCRHNTEGVLQLLFTLGIDRQRPPSTNDEMSEACRRDHVTRGKNVGHGKEPQEAQKAQEL